MDSDWTPPGAHDPPPRRGLAGSDVSAEALYQKGCLHRLIHTSRLIEGTSGCNQRKTNVTRYFTQSNRSSKTVINFKTT